MPHNAFLKPKIVWGTTSGSYTNTITFGDPLDDPVPPYSEPRPGSVTVQVESGESDAWVIGWDYYLEGTAKWIPGVDVGSVTGWEGSTGWDAFLRTASSQLAFRFYPDASSGTYYTCWLVEPFGSQCEYQMNGTRWVRLKIRNIVGPFTGYA